MGVSQSAAAALWQAQAAPGSMPCIIQAPHLLRGTHTLVWPACPAVASTQKHQLTRPTYRCATSAYKPQLPWQIACGGLHAAKKLHAHSATQPAPTQPPSRTPSATPPSSPQPAPHLHPPHCRLSHCGEGPIHLLPPIQVVSLAQAAKHLGGCFRGRQAAEGGGRGGGSGSGGEARGSEGGVRRNKV